MKTKDKSQKMLTATLIGSMLLLGGCAVPYGGQDYRGASNPPSQNYPTNQQAYQQNQQSYQQSYNNGRGVVEAIDMIQGESQSQGIGGALLGGVVGGVLGHQIGHGTGNTVATIAGAAGGALAGNQLEKSGSRSPASYNVRIRMNNNSYQTINVSNPGDLRVGDRVRVDNGQISRY